MRGHLPLRRRATAPEPALRQHGYSISASADLKFSGDVVSGTWEEKTYSANGAITGKLTDTGFLLSISGPTFSAAMPVEHTTCKQSIDIEPTGVDVSRIKIGLGKCYDADPELRVS